MLSDSVILFGATGDLARKKLFPALYRLCRDSDVHIPVIGVARSDWSDDDLRDRARVSIEEAGEPLDEAVFAAFASHLGYVRGNYNDPATFARLDERMEGAHAPLSFLAIPPSMFGVVVEGLASVGLDEAGRVVVEKPFGRDLASARELNQILLAALLTGSVVVEEIFALPGVGTHFVRSALNRDYNLVLGTIILYSTILVALNLLVDVLYTILDPRVSYD